MVISPIWDRVQEFLYDISRNVDRRIRVLTRRPVVRKSTPTYSWSRPNYEYWDRVYSCVEPGFEISGLFYRPIVNKVAEWVLGRQPNFVCNDKPSQKNLQEWWDLHHEEFLQAYKEALKLGDHFAVINSDLSVTLVPAKCVDPIVDPNDFSTKIGIRITQVYQDPNSPSSKMTVVDEYYADRRIVITTFSDGRSDKKFYLNLIGIIPVVHIANNKKGGEEFGHPEAEAMLDLFLRYGQTLEAAIEGNILQGRPTPVLSFKTLQDLNAYWRRYGKKETVTKSDGTIQEIDTLAVDMSDLMTVSGADFKYESPGSFAQDTERLLGLMFYLALEHIELPEFVFGNAIEGSKASAETQMPIFEVFIRMRQKECAPWIRQVSKIVQAFNSILKPGSSTEEATLQWPKLSQNGRLTKESVEWAFDKGLLGDRDSLLLLPLDVENPDRALSQAKKDAKRRKRENLKDMEDQAKIQASVSPPSQVEEMDSELSKELADLAV